MSHKVPYRDPILHYILVALSLVLVLSGWYGVYDSTVHSASQGTVSLAGVFGNLATMVVGCLMAILARLAQAARHQREILRQLRGGARPTGAVDTEPSPTVVSPAPPGPEHVGAPEPSTPGSFSGAATTTRESGPTARSSGPAGVRPSISGDATPLDPAALPPDVKIVRSFEVHDYVIQGWMILEDRGAHVVMKKRPGSK